MNYACLAAGTAIISGRKSLETCQAYILLSLYPKPARRWAEDRRWMYLGCAIRMATDLNLHNPAVLEGGEPAVTISTIMDVEWQSREILNRTRCWLGCFNADKAMSTQFGKPMTLREGSSSSLISYLCRRGVLKERIYRLDVPAKYVRRRGRMVVSYSFRMEIRHPSMRTFRSFQRNFKLS